MKTLLKSLYFTLFTVCAAATVQAQVPPLSWVNRVGAALGETGHVVTSDASGNIYVAGTYAGTVDFDPGPGTAILTSNAGNIDVYVQKLGPNGNHLWAVSTSGPSNDTPYGIGVDASGNVFVAGRFEGTVDFDPGVGTTNLTVSGGWDSFVWKLSSSGALLWAKGIGGTGYDSASDLAVDPSGDVIVGGYYAGTVDFDPGAGTASMTTGGTSEAYILKLTNAGDFGFVKTFAGTFSSETRALALDVAGNIYFAGNFDGSLDADPGAPVVQLISAGNIDMFTIKLTNSGSFRWGKRIGDVNFDIPHGIAVDKEGASYTSSNFTGSLDADPSAGTFTVTSNGSSDILICKLDSNGGFDWAGSLGGTGPEGWGDIATDGQDNVYFSGEFSTSLDADIGAGVQTIAPSGAQGAFIIKVGKDMTFRWVAKFDGLPYVACDALEVTSTGDVMVHGMFGDSVDFDPGPGLMTVVSAGNTDAFTLKLHCAIGQGSISPVSCGGDYTINGQTYISTGTYTQSFATPAGCDSILTINLTIPVFNTGVIQAGQVLSAVQSGQQYQWLDCDNGFAAIPGATQASFVPATSGNYAVHLMNSGCGDTSSCIAVTVVGIPIPIYSERMFSIYPNPSEGNFTLDLSNLSPAPVTLELVSLTGKVVWSGAGNGGAKHETSLPKLPAGVYGLRVKQGGLFWWQRVLLD